jgi:hypothetical protein
MAIDAAEEHGEHNAECFNAGNVFLDGAHHDA